MNAASGIGTADNPLNISVSTLDAAVSNGSLHLQQTGQRLTLNSLQAGGPFQDVTVISDDALVVGVVKAADQVTLQGTSLLDANGQALNVLAVGTQLTATQSDVGSLSDPLETSVNTVSASASRDIAIQEANAITIGTLSAGNEVSFVNQTGDVTLGLVSAPTRAEVRAVGFLMDGNGDATNIASRFGILQGRSVGTGGARVSKRRSPFWMP